MTDGTFFSRAWPSIVALVGTVAVVFALLFVFGDDGNGGNDDDPAADDPVDDGAPADGATEDGSGDGTDGGDSDPVGDPTESPDEGTTADPDAPPPVPVDAPPELRRPVGILNSTDVAGLASGAQERFVDGGWDVPAVTDYSGQVEGTTVFYPSDDLLASAEALAGQFPEIRFVEPTISGLATDRLIVVLAEDYAEAVGAAESGESG